MKTRIGSERHNGEVVEHKTYVAAECIRCRSIALRICVVHDECVYGHSSGNCDKDYRQLCMEANETLRGLQELERVEGGELIAYALAYLEEAYDVIKARK